MKHNMGRNEKIARMVGGLGLFLAGWLALKGYGIFVGMVTGLTVFGFALSAVAVVVFITGLLSYCPVNALVHHNSCEACRIGETHRHLPI